MGNKTIDLLNRLSDAMEGASDYVVAENLAVTRATVSKWRTGHGTMSDETALRAARLTGESEDLVLIEIAAERATTETAKIAYRRIAERLRASAAIATLGFVAFFAGFSHSPTAQASEVTYSQSVLW